jgi:hypothetical protein
MIDKDVVDKIEVASKKTTRGNWRTAKFTSNTHEQTIEFISNSIRMSNEDPTINCLVAMADESNPVDELLDSGNFVITLNALNGPTGEQNVKFVELAHNYMPEIIRDLKNYRMLQESIVDYANKHSLPLHEAEPENGRRIYPMGFKALMDMIDL